MEYKSLARNLLAAFAAQGVSFLASIATSLIVPKLLGVEEFGYWQLFVFYASYSGFFLFGLCDGIYLLNGGVRRDEIDKRGVNSQFLVGLCLVSLSGIVIGAIAFLTAQGEERAFVLLAFAAYMVVYNMSGLLGYTFQAMNETRLFSYSVMIDRFFFFAALVVLIAFHVTDFRVYVMSFCLSKAACLCYCGWKARDILRAGLLPSSRTLALSFDSIRVGYKLMVAQIADMLILGICRLLVDTAWGIEAFANVSLSIALVNFFITFVSQASMVLFPALRQGTEAERRKVYRSLRDVLELVFPSVFLLYFPMVWGLSLWLPQYGDSLRYFAFLLPICVFNSKMDICCFTYLKVLRMEGFLLKANLVTVFASLALALIGVFVLGSLDAVLLGAVVCIAVRSLACERGLDKANEVPGNVMAYEELLLAVVFIASALLLSGTIGFAVYFVVYLAYVVRNRDAAGVLKALANKVLRR